MLSYEFPRQADAPAITALYETHLNSGEPIRHFVEACLSHPDFAGVKCVDRKQNTIVGVVLAKPGIEFTCPHPTLEAAIRQRFDGSSIYSIDMLVVEPAYRMDGIGTHMIQLLRKQLLERKIQYVLLEAWQPVGSQEVPASRPYAYLGRGEVLAVEPDFYHNLNRCGLTCPICGPDCRCGAVISVIHLQDTPDAACW